MSDDIFIFDESGTILKGVRDKTIKKVIIPNGVKTIGEYAFSWCEGLTSVTIGNSVTTIGESAFNRCSGLTSITIPNSVTTIGYGAFRECSGLTSIEIPNSVTSIGDRAFQCCSGLTSVTIGKSVASIGKSVFYECTGLTSIEIPNSVISIGQRAFGDSYGLNSVILGKNVKEIGDYAFKGCRRLQKLIIPKSVEHIGKSAFDGCPISKVHLPNSTKYEEHSFDVITKVMKCLITISYSWDNKEHIAWVKKLADDLEENSIDVILDQNNLSYGAELTSFMEKSISKADRVLCILTPNYKKKTDGEEGGVGYEYSIIKEELLHRTDIPKNKFIPILREGSINESCPRKLKGNYMLKFMEKDDYDKKLQELIDDILYKTDDVIS